MRTWQVRGICIVVLLILLLGARAIQSLAVSSHAPTSMSFVAIVPASGGVEGAVRQAVAQAGGLADMIEPGDLVVIKVNLVMDAPASSGMVTDPAVARAVVRLAREAGAGQVSIVEGTAQYREGDVNRDRFCTQAAFHAAGYDADGDMVDDATGAPLVDLNNTGGTDLADPATVTKVIVPTGLIRKEYWLPNVVLNADVLISVPVLKNHYLAGVTLGMKNLIGLLPNDLYHGPGNIYGKHSLSHSPIELDQHIVDVNLARRPDFVVIDGQRGMTDGPIGNQITSPPMSLILAGQDLVAVDTVGTLVMGYDPRTIPYLGLGAKSGLGATDTSYIQVIGIPLTQARRDFPAPYADSPAQQAERQPPTVTIAAPDKGEWLGTVSVTVEASDNDAIARVEFYLDGQQLGQTLTSPYEFKIDTGHFPSGAHTLRVVAYDRCLNQSEVSREIHFTAPTATFTPTSLPPTNTVTRSATATLVSVIATPAAAESLTTTYTAKPLEPATALPGTSSPLPATRSTPAGPHSATPSIRVISPTNTSLTVAQAPEEVDSILPESMDTTQRQSWDWLLYAACAFLALLGMGTLIVTLGILISSQRRRK